MLLLTRRIGEQIRLDLPTGSEVLEVISSTHMQVGDKVHRMSHGVSVQHGDVTITFASKFKQGQIRLGFEAPQSIKILRMELVR